MLSLPLRAVILVNCLQIDADFIAQYQMNYGCGENADTSAQYSDEYWSNPPSDINSEEYRIWYERYCSYFYPQTASETNIASLSADTNETVGLNALLGSIDSTVSSTTLSATDKEKSADNSNNIGAGNAVGKKRKKAKKDSAVNPQPAEPPGELLF